MYYGSSAIGNYYPEKWPQGQPAPDPAKEKKYIKTSKKAKIPNNTNSTENKVTEQRTRLNNPSEACTAQKVDFSELNLHDLLKFRECSSCIDRVHDELIDRLNKKINTLPHFGISRMVLSTPLLNQIIHFFGVKHCAKIEQLDLTYTENDFTLLQHFTGLKVLNLTSTSFNEFWVLEPDHMPNLVTLVPSLEKLKELAAQRAEEQKNENFQHLTKW